MTKPTELSWKDGGAERQTHSFLVRLWKEPRKVEGEGAAVRGYVRNLQTGEEHYLTDPGAIGELLERSLDGVRRTEDAKQARPAKGRKA